MSSLQADLHERLLASVGLPVRLTDLEDGVLPPDGPAFEERRFDAFRAYYRFVPQGRWVVEYTLRLSNPGTFLLPPTRVEAMYAPDVQAVLKRFPGAEILDVKEPDQNFLAPNVSESDEEPR